MKEKADLITSYDLLKSLALILMVIDHVGVYFLPDISELRLLGRLSAPIWLFLIGYAKTRGDIFRLCIAGLLAQISYWLLNDQFFFLDILFLMALCRLVMDRFMSFALARKEHFYSLTFLFALLMFPTEAIVMYGTIGAGFVMLGYMMRNQQGYPILTASFIIGYAAYLLIAYAFYSLVKFPDFSAGNIYMLIVGVFLILMVMFFFRPAHYDAFERPALSWAKLPLRLMGRYSLEFYVGHLILFRAASYYIQG